MRPGGGDIGGIVPCAELLIDQSFEGVVYCAGPSSSGPGFVDRKKAGPIQVGKMNFWKYLPNRAVWALLVLILGPLMQTVRASLPLVEGFSYSDGRLEEVSGGVWSIRSGNPRLEVEDQALVYRWSQWNLEENYTGYYTRELGTTVTEGRVIADFRVRFDELDTVVTGDQWVFLQFTNETGGARRGRLYGRLEAGGENMQLGISSLSSNAVKWSNRSFAAGETHHLELAYDVETGETFLSVDPASGGPPILTDQDDNKHAIGRLSVEIDTRRRLGKYRIFDMTVSIGAADPPEPEVVVEVLLAESFPYVDGPLLADAPGWRIRSGQVAHAVERNRLLLVPDGVEGDGYLTRNLSRSVDETPVYFAFDLSLPAELVAHDPINILFLTDAAGASGRGYVVAEGSPRGWRIGLRATANGAVVWSRGLEEALSTARWVVRFDPGTGISRLWRSQGDVGGEPEVEIAGSPLAVGRIAIGSDARMPSPALGLGAIHVATTAEKALSPPIDTVVLPHADKVFLFLLIGQSNMAGRGVVEEEDRHLDRRILVFNRDRDWEVAREPLHWDRPGFNGVGPGLSFARTLLPDLPPDAVIGLIPAAAGGTSIAWWTKTYAGANTYYGGQYLYPHAVSRARDALRNGRLAGILWNQGESDGGSAENDGGRSYRTRLHQLIADLRSDLDAPEAPFLVSTLGPWRNTPALNSVFLSLPDEVPFTAAVNTRDPAVIDLLVNNPNDLPHYLTPSYRLLGQLYGEQFRPFWKPETAFARSPGGQLEAGSARFRIGFTATGAWRDWQANGVSLLPAGTEAGWRLDGQTDLESLSYAENPPLSWKWRSPRSMASWTVGEGEFGVVLANNDIEPALFILPLDPAHITHYRTPDGTWRGRDDLAGSTAVNRLRWELPDGTIGLWCGEGWVEKTEEGESLAIQIRLEPGEVADWSWRVGEVALVSPQPHAVYQRSSRTRGQVLVEGTAPAGSVAVRVEFRGVGPQLATPPAEPVELLVDPATGAFSQLLELAAGGWYAMDLSVRDQADRETAALSLQPFGVGEVFVVAGQSNSTNSGQTRTRSSSGLVSAFSGSGWQPAHDPLPGTHDNAVGGSFQPALGDALAAHWGVPIGFASTGQGGSGIRHWQLDYAPNFESNTFHNGLYPWTLHRMRQLGTQGFRALLWHQGESNAARGVSTDASKIETYSDALIRVLSHWREDAGWAIPVLTAQVSLWPMENAAYGGDPFLRAAQERVWNLGFGLPGPDTDQLGLEFRQDNSPSRVHFNAAGLRAHGELWMESLQDFINRKLLENDRVQIRARQEDGDLILRFPAPAGGEWVAETSPDLRNWSFWQQVPVETPPAMIELRDSAVAGSDVRFYRLRGVEGR